MKFNKKFAKASAFALVLGAFSLFSGYEAKASSVTAPTGYEFDGELETIKVGTAKYWAIVKVVKEAKKADLTIDDTKYLQVDTIEPVTGTHIDVSNLKKNKELNLILGTTDVLNAAGWKLITVPAQAKDFTAHYLSTADDKEANEKGTPDGGYLVFKKNKTSVTDMLTADKYMVKIGNGSWTKFEETFSNTEDTIGKKLANLTQLGATLSFKAIGTKSTASSNGTWASKESKIKISPRGKAPSVKIDPVKGTVSVKKGMEFVVPADGTSTLAGNESFKKVEKAKSVLADVGLGNVTKNIHLLVRTAATNKKLASKVQDITVKFQAAPTEGKADATAEGGAILTNVTVATKVPYDISKGATISNDTDTEYEFYISPKGTEIKDPKWTKLKARKANKKGGTTPTVVALKYAKDGKDYTYGSTNNSTKIFIRFAGKKQHDNEVTLPSAPAEIALKLANATQEVALSGAGNPNGTTTATANITATPGTTHKIAVKVTKLYSSKAPSLKVKVTKKADGVSLKGGKFDKASGVAGTAQLEVKLSKNVFKKANSAVVDAEFSVEGVKGTIKITVTKQG